MSTAPPTHAGITEVLSYLHRDSCGIEIRAPKFNGTQNVVSRFKPGDHEEAARVALQLSGRAPAVYVVLNGVDPILPVGQNLKGTQLPNGKYQGAGARTGDIRSRRHILIDYDPVRAADTSATEAEKRLAADVRGNVWKYLSDRQWPNPLFADTGNGYHDVYPTDLPADVATTALIKDLLKVLDAQFSTPGCKIDTSVFDLPRLVKVYGTLAAKGENTEERPHRYSRVLSMPASADRGFVTAEMIRAVIEELAPPKQATAPARKVKVAAESEGAFGSVATNGPTAASRARAYVFAPRFPDSISGDHGHNRLFHVVCVLVDGFGLSRAEAEPIFRDWNQAKAQPPESDDQVEHKLDDAFNKFPAPSRKLLLADRNGFDGPARQAKSSRPHSAPRLDRKESAMIRPFDAWTLARLLAGKDVNGEPQTVSERFRRVAEHLAAKPVEARLEAWEGFLCSVPEPHKVIMTLAEVDPLGLPPELEPLDRCATLADLRRIVADDQWLWKGWLATGVLNGLAADPGIGKTILAVFLALTLWFKNAWPDGQPNTMPEGTRTLMVPGDRHYAQLIDLAGKFGLPDKAILFNAPARDPTAGLDLDDPAELSALSDRIESERPGLVVMDTVGQTTGKNLCKPEDARDYFGPLMDLSLRTSVTFLLLTHLSRDGQALGRRISGACRVVLKMTDPDPDGQPDRRRVWVDKSYAEKPPALGMTISSDGCSFDSKPPTAPEPSKGGRPPDERAKAKQFIVEALTHENDQIGNDLCHKWEEAGGNDKTFWRAVRELSDAGTITTDGGKGTGKQMVLHLVRTDHGPETDDPF
jgi:hypothetical protein